MKIKEAWDKFEKTGLIEQYLEYRRLCEEKEKSVNNNRGSSDKIDEYR